MPSTRKVYSSRKCIPNLPRIEVPAGNAGAGHMAWQGVCAALDRLLSEGAVSHG